MTTTVRHTPTITGDVAAVSQVTVNTKGGSVTATLKKAIRDRLGKIGGQLSAAALEFGNGSSVVLMSAGSVETSLRVHKIGANRFEIEIINEQEEEIDNVAAAFINLKKSQFEAGTLPLMEPITADQWREEMDKKLSGAIAAAEMFNLGTKTKA